MSPRVCIFVATKNRPLMIQKFVQMVVSQMSAYDYLVIADASDNGFEIDYVSDNRVLVIKNHTKGISANRNVALKEGSNLDFDLWTFMDDDIQIPPNYIHQVKDIFEILPKRASFTGSINGEFPKAPDWLGFYTKKISQLDRKKLMPNSVGTWIPKITKKPFSYASDYLYGYDELEIADYIYCQNLDLIYLKSLDIQHDNVLNSTRKLVSDIAFHNARIEQNSMSRRTRGSSNIMIQLFRLRCYVHLLIRGNFDIKLWVIRKFKNISLKDI